MSRPAPRVGLLDPVPDQVHTTLFRALAVLRVVVACYVVVLDASRWRELDRPVLGWLVVAVVVGWTGFAAWAYDEPARRGLPLLVLDLAVATGALLLTPVVESNHMLARNASSLPSFWVVVPVLAWAVARGWPGGVAAGLVVSVADLSVREHPDGTTWGNIFLLLVAAGIVGYSSTLIRAATEARAEAERLAAMLAERARLARAVHDGVLQVLALVQRRAPELGRDGAELGRLAGAQEVALRGLVQGDAVAGRDAGMRESGSEDLVEAVRRLASPTVTVSVPVTPLPLPSLTVRELVAVVAACVDNVSRHVGADAPCWVLVESVRGDVLVTVRDEGPGIPAGRLEQARAEGRLGVAESVRGRMADLGGEAVLITGPGQGTEWELRLPASSSGP